MIAGTFREWVDDGTPGIFRVTDERGTSTTVQLAEDRPGQISYEVFLGSHRDGVLRSVECHFNHIDMIVQYNILAWETPGEVIDG